MARSLKNGADRVTNGLIISLVELSFTRVHIKEMLSATQVSMRGPKTFSAATFF